MLISGTFSYPHGLQEVTEWTFTAHIPTKSASQRHLRAAVFSPLPPSLLWSIVLSFLLSFVHCVCHLMGAPSHGTYVKNLRSLSESIRFFTLWSCLSFHPRLVSITLMLWTHSPPSDMLSTAGPADPHLTLSHWSLSWPGNITQVSLYNHLSCLFLFFLITYNMCTYICRFV